ncbi:MAG: T9SS type A sorting domain-containing protein [Saprospiraceae bacterium]|nr:T9SS type A sorting domain-containing protein [Saprospiraceae bacterium]
MILSSVSSTQPYWYNKARVLEVLVKKWQGEDPDSAEMLMLEDMANLCPFEGGKGVYMARGILSEYILEEVIYDDLAKCDSLIPRTVKHKTASFQIYPNPTQHEFILESNRQMETVAVWNTAGKLMYHSEVNDKTSRIATQDWPAGVYIIQVKFKNENGFESKKVIVIP